MKVKKQGLQSAFPEKFKTKRSSLREKKEISMGLNLLAKSSIIVFIGLFLSKIFTYVYRIIIARYFGPEIYGLFSLAVMVVGLFIAISSLGFIEGLIRYAALYRGKKEFGKIKYLFKVSLVILTASTFFFALVLFFLSGYISIKIFHSQELISFLKTFSIVIPLFIFSSVFYSIIRAFEKISWYSFITNILQNVIKVLILILFIFLGFKSNAIIFSYVLGILGMLIVSYIVCKYKIPEVFGKNILKKKLKKEINREFFSYSWPLMFLGIITTLFYWIDSFAIGYFKGPLFVGFYNAAIPIIYLMGFAQELFMQLFFPLITKEFSKKNFNVIKELSKQVGKWIFVLNLPIFLLIFLFSGAVINLLFGKEYLVAETALRILSIGAVISSSLALPTNILLMLGKSKLILINLIVMSVVNIILNILLVPEFGINGAAISTSIILTTITLILFLEVRYYTSIIPLKKEMLRILIVSIVPTALLFLLTQIIPINLFSIMLLGVFFVLSYLFLIFVTGCLDKNDLMILKNLKRKITDNIYLGSSLSQ